MRRNWGDKIYFYREIEIQYLNKNECLLKLRKAIEKLNYKKPKRRPTKMSKSTKLKNKAKKLKTSATKRSRAKPKED